MIGGGPGVPPLGPPGLGTTGSRVLGRRGSFSQSHPHPAFAPTKTPSRGATHYGFGSQELHHPSVRNLGPTKRLSLLHARQ